MSLVSSGNTGNVVLLDELGEAEVFNETDVGTEEVFGALRRQQAPILRALSAWALNAQGGGAAGGFSEGEILGPDGHPARRQGGLFERDRFVTPSSVFDQMRLAYEAVEHDDVVAGACESTESLAFSKVSFYAEDEDEEDIYNQIAADIDLDSRLREMWRELFTVSQFYCAVWWHTKTYKVRGKSERGINRKKEYSVRCPRALTLLDPLKIVPVGNMMFNREQLVYCADRSEAEAFDRALTGQLTDPIAMRLMMGRFEPNDGDRRWLADLGIDTRNLFELNPANVFRHTATRPQFQKFATVRLKSVFELLDLKNQLRQMDRAHLIGGTNFIVLITKGSDQWPAKPNEMANLQNNVRPGVRVPVLIGDHRLKVEIITPKLDTTLDPKRYATLNNQITARLFQMFLSGDQAGTKSDDSAKLVKVIARGMESRRHMLRRVLETNIFDRIFNTNEGLTTAPELRFHPRQIALDFDPNFASFLIELRLANEISRETLLSQFDMDQGDEARLVERERDKYDDIFMTQVPFSGENPALPGGGGGQPDGGGGASNGGAPIPPHGHAPTGEPVALPATKPAKKATKKATTPAEKRQAGRSGGGNRSGGGAAPGTGQGQPARRPRKKSD